jgi:bacillopeptidase F
MISLTTTQSDLGWTLYSDASFTTPLKVCDAFTTAGPNNESCFASLSAGVNYYLAVREGDAVAGTYVLTVTPPVVPTRPTGVTATASYGKVTLSWFVSAAATTYNVYWSMTSGAGTAGNKIGNITTTNYSHVVSTPSITYYYVVTAENANGESVPSTPEVSATPPAPLVPPLTYDFETNTLQGWTTNWIWAPSTIYAHGGTHSVTDSPIGMYADSSNTWLASPMIDLTATSAPKLTFWHRYDIETGYDYAYVELSSDGGATWTSIAPAGPYGNRYTGPLSTFTLVTIDISAYKTSAAVVIRFRLQTDTSTQHDGWYIDDIGISAN